MLQWRMLSKAQKISRLREEEAEVRKNVEKAGKEERLEMVRKLKEIWRKREEELNHEEDEKPEKEGSPEEDEAAIDDLNLLEIGEFLDAKQSLCLNCLLTPCICDLNYLEMKLTCWKSAAEASEQ